MIMMIMIRTLYVKILSCLMLMIFPGALWRTNLRPCCTATETQC
jgi:hypothetical protein